MELKIRKPFEPHDHKGLIFEDIDPETGEIIPCQVKQADKDSCDINKIMARYERTGQLPEMISRNPQYGDFSNVPDYQRSLEIVAKAEEQFMALDARVRARFNHDPKAMLEFCSNPANNEEMIKMGLALPVKAAAVDNSVSEQGSPAASGATTPQK